MDKYLQGFSKDPRLKMTVMMTFEQLVGYAPDFTEDKKQALYAELAAVPEDED